MGCSERQPVTTALWRKKLGPRGSHTYLSRAPQPANNSLGLRRLAPNIHWGCDCCTMDTVGTFPVDHSGWLGSLSRPPFGGPVLS